MISAIAQSITTRLCGPQGRRFILAFGAAVIARLGHLALAILLARGIGPTDYGTFAFALGAAALAANFANLGWPNLFNRLFPQFVRDADWNRLKGLRDGADMVVVVSLALAALVLIGLANVHDGLRLGLIFSAMLVAPLGLAMMRKQQLAALKRPAIGLMFDQGFAAIIVAMILLLTGLANLRTVVLIYTGATLVGILVTTVMVRRLLPEPVSTAQRLYEFGDRFRLALPMFMGTISRTLLNRMDVLMLAPLASLHAVGIYGAAWRLTYLLTFPQVVLMTIVTPLLSEAFADKNTAKVRNIMRLSAIFAACTTAPFVIVFVLAPSMVMRWVFGEQFAEGGSTLLILGVGQFLAAFTNANAALLMMGGWEKKFGAVSLTVLLAALVSNVMLIPRFGANGAAMTTVASSALLLAGQLYLSRHLLNSMSNDS